MTRLTSRYHFVTDEAAEQFQHSMDTQQRITFLSWRLEAVQLSVIEDRIRAGRFTIKDNQLWV